jgi:hypothetical protein
MPQPIKKAGMLIPYWQHIKKEKQMVKNFKYFRIQIGGKRNNAKADSAGKATYRHSLYMQSKDSTWISRNTIDDEGITDSNDKDELDS